MVFLKDIFEKVNLKKLVAIKLEDLNRGPEGPEALT